LLAINEIEKLRGKKMLYDLLFSKYQIQRLRLVLESARDMKIIIPEEAQQMLDYIVDEVEVQDRAVRLAGEGKDIFESMKIKVPR
jgi:hypothetical protein